MSVRESNRREIDLLLSVTNSEENSILRRGDSLKMLKRVSDREMKR